MNSFVLETCLVFANLPSLGLSSPVARIHDRPCRWELVVSTWVTSQSFPSVSCNMVSRQSGIPSLPHLRSSMPLLFALTYAGNCMHDLCFHCLSLQLLLPLCTQFAYPHMGLLSVPREPMVSLPSPFQIWPIIFHCLESFLHFFATVTHCHPFLPWPTHYLSFRYHLRCLLPIPSTVSLDEMFSYATSSTVISCRLHYCVYFNCLYPL